MRTLAFLFEQYPDFEFIIKVSTPTTYGSICDFYMKDVKSIFLDLYNSKIYLEI